jgi:hypothetical protein
MTRADVRRQLPVRTPRHDADADADGFARDEAYVRRYFGPAAHILTVALARRLAPHLPLAFPALHGQTWSSHVYSGETAAGQRLGDVETVTLLRWNEGDRTMTVTASDNPFQYELSDDGEGNLGSGSGADPVYLFYAAAGP